MLSYSARLSRRIVTRPGSASAAEHRKTSASSQSSMAASSAGRGPRPAARGHGPGAEGVGDPAPGLEARGVVLEVIEGDPALVSSRNRGSPGSSGRSSGRRRLRRSASVGERDMATTGSTPRPSRRREGSSADRRNRRSPIRQARTGRIANLVMVRDREIGRGAALARGGPPRMGTWHGLAPGGSVAVAAEDLAAGPGDQGGHDRDRERILEEVDRAVANRALAPPGWNE